MGVAGDQVGTALAPGAALELWLDTARWPSFVDGLARVERRDPRWPERGAAAVWQSRPGGRGRVTVEVVEVDAPRRVVMAVSDETLEGRETATFEAAPGGSLVRVELDYTLRRGGPLRAIADAVFIRRALRDSVRRTLQRFAAEAAEDSALPR